MSYDKMSKKELIILNKVLIAELKDIQNWLVCYPISSPSDMCEYIPSFYESISNVLNKAEGKGKYGI